MVERAQDSARLVRVLSADSREVLPQLSLTGSLFPADSPCWWAAYHRGHLRAVLFFSSLNGKAPRLLNDNSDGFFTDLNPDYDILIRAITEAVAWPDERVRAVAPEMLWTRQREILQQEDNPFLPILAAEFLRRHGGAGVIDAICGMPGSPRRTLFDRNTGTPGRWTGCRRPESTSTSPATDSEEDRTTSRLLESFHLFRQARDARAAGDRDQALVLLHQAMEAPVAAEAFQATLEQTILDTATEGLTGPWAGILPAYLELLGRPDTLYHVSVEPLPDLPPAYFVHYLRIRHALGRSGMVPAAAELRTADTCYLAGALFCLRKSTLESRQRDEAVTALLERWSEDPEIWNGVCTRQALLFLGQLPTLPRPNPEADHVKFYLSTLESAGREGGELELMVLNRKALHGGELTLVSQPGTIILDDDETTVNWVGTACRLPLDAGRHTIRILFKSGGSAPPREFPIVTGAVTRLIIPMAPEPVKH